MGRGRDIVQVDARPRLSLWLRLLLALTPPSLSLLLLRPVPRAHPPCPLPPGPGPHPLPTSLARVHARVALLPALLNSYVERRVRKVYTQSYLALLLCRTLAALFRLTRPSRCSRPATMAVRGRAPIRNTKGTEAAHDGEVQQRAARR